MNQEYIHINKACKKYWKSRQTFYNYMNKNRVRHKKVHNKVFLHVDDIESVLSDTQKFNTIQDKNPEIIRPRSTNQESLWSNFNVDQNGSNQISETRSIHNAKKRIDDIHTSLSTHIDITAQEIRKETNQKIQIVDQNTNKNQELLSERIKKIEEELETRKKQNNIHQFIYIFSLISVIISLLFRFFWK